jgi:hypothetical protein
MGKLNPWLVERLEEAKKRASPLRYIVEVKPDTRATVKEKLLPIPNLEVISQPADRFIVVEAPPEALPLIEAIPQVVKVSAETLVWIKEFPLPLPPLQLTKFDPYLGEVRLSRVEIEAGPVEGIATLPLIGIKSLTTKVYTTDYTRRYLKVPEENKIKTRVAVLDTGLVWPHALMRKSVHLESFTGEPPLDGQGHGTWCSACAFGDSATHPRYGRCVGIADPEEQMHGKVLSNAGFGMTSWILDGMFRAVMEYGAKVVSMSLGGPLQGSAVNDDPTCRLIRVLADEAIFIVAAGNEGPDEWTIGSPGAAPEALTIASWGITRNDVAGFSSRGPSGEYYKNNPDIWERDLARAGENLIKPDCAAPGGDDKANEKILSGCAGWYDAIADILPQWGVMSGTSMATPHVAGIVSLAYDRGLVRTADDVRAKLRRRWAGAKSIEVGYGLLTWDRLM